MTATLGLSDVQRFWFEIAISILGAIQAFIVAEALRGEVVIPVMTIFYLNLIVAALAPIKAILGVRDSTTARVAKETNPALHQVREPSKEQLSSQPASA